MGKVVALDIGIASVGYCVIDRITERVLESGSNIFPEASAIDNQTRREMRQSRRGKRRQKTRLNDFNKLWKNNGLNIPVNSKTNIVDLKVKALKESIELDELYLILYHYLKHRGISYLEDADNDAVSGNSSYANGLRLNAKELEVKLPCEIQQDRLDKVGKYRGQIQIIDGNNEKIDLSNVFTVSAYLREIQCILKKQREFHCELTDSFCEDYLLIFERKRKYYEGPGNEKSRTDYGKYTTKINALGEYITEKNIFEKLIGKCSVYHEELRASAASYTAQEFNLLNDLNNLTINGRKLEEGEKHEIVNSVKNKSTINMRKIISETIGEIIIEFDGARIDKNNKEIFHKFEVYNKMKRSLKDIDFDINMLSREELDEIGHILTINTDKEAMLEAFQKSTLKLSEVVIDSLIELRKKNSSLFSKWHSFSLKIMNELIPEMYQQPKEQMTLLTEMGVLKGKGDELIGLKYLPTNIISDDIFNPVVRRSVRIATKILNALIKKYGILDEIVIEMPRDRNSDEEKKRIKDTQKKNENEITYVETKLKKEYGIHISSSDYSAHKQLRLKLKLWNEQDGRCIYSNKMINPQELLDNPDKFEIDHIIPRSISFDDSRNNKVLVYQTENQKKGNRTPYYYLSQTQFDQFKETVLNLEKKRDYGFSRKKVKNLLFLDDITKIDVMRGFINRNLNDTRYASRVILNTIQSFFKVNKIETKVKTIRGSYTHQMRVNLNLEKNREESYAHHAVDAMLIAFSQLGYESYRKLQGEFIDFDTGEILNPKMWEENMTDEVYKDYLYGNRWLMIRTEINRAAGEVKYWHYVDRKSNRGLCNQTIRGTREYNGKTYKINKLDIRSKEGAKTFKKLAMSQKESDRERLLVYKNDRKTFDQLVQIVNDYADTENPFVQYEKETGDYVRKYAKKHNGPIINKLKYTDGEVGACIDISEKYKHDINSKKVILESLVPFRMDVYFKHENQEYYLVGVKQSDLKYENGKYMIDEEAYAKTLVNEKMIIPGQTRKDLEKLGFEFRLSFYKNDVIEYEKDGAIFLERFLSRTMPQNRNYIETKPIDRAKFEKRRPVGLGKTNSIKKYRVDILGEYYPCEKESFSKYC